MSTWMEQPNVPFQKYSNPILINNDTILMAPNNEQPLDDWMMEFGCLPQTQQSDGIYAYHVDKKKWDLYIKYKHQLIIQDHSILYDNKKNLLLICGRHTEQNKMIVVDLNSNTFDTITMDLCQSAPPMLLIAGQYHIFSTMEDSTHYIWNKTENKLKVLHRFNEDIRFDERLVRGLLIHECFYIEANHCILLLGMSWSFDKSVWVPKLYSMDMNKQDWKQVVDVHLPAIPGNRGYGGYLLTNDQKNIILFVGTDNNYGIYILNTSSFECTKSKVGMPTKNVRGNILITENETQNNMSLMNGYIRRERAETLPNDIESIILGYFNRPEMIHFFSMSSQKHWTISLKALLQ